MEAIIALLAVGMGILVGNTHQINTPMNKDTQYLQRHTILARKSWVAYLTLFKELLACSVIWLVLYWLRHKVDAIWLSLIFTATIGSLIYSIAKIRSYSLLLDENGIWLSSGILPWNRGIIGVKWRDLDEALYYPTFFSWASNSYKIRLSHRYTKDSEIVIDNMHKGKNAVEQINTTLIRLTENRY